MKTLSTHEKIAVFVGLVVIALFFIIGPAFLGPLVGLVSEIDVRDERDRSIEVSTETMQVEINDIKVGEGQEAQNGDRVVVHYTGRLENGVVFDSSLERGTPFTFTLGAGQVISGWDQGILGMKVGGDRTLTIPPELAYGDQGIGPIPPGATLIFDVTLIGIEE